MQLLQASNDQNILVPIITGTVLVGIFAFIIYRRYRVWRAIYFGTPAQAEVIAVDVSSVTVNNVLRMTNVTLSIDTDGIKREVVAWQGFTRDNMPEVGQTVDIRIDKKNEDFVRIMV